MERRPHERYNTHCQTRLPWYARSSIHVEVWSKTAISRGPYTHAWSRLLPGGLFFFFFLTLLHSQQCRPQGSLVLIFCASRLVRLNFLSSSLSTCSSSASSLLLLEVSSFAHEHDHRNHTISTHEGRQTVSFRPTIVVASLSLCRSRTFSRTRVPGSLFVSSRPRETT